MRNAPHLKWRVLRSQEGFAATADVPGDNGQTLVMEDEEDHLDDVGLDEHAHYYYTVFCQNEQGEWQRQVEVKVKPHDAWHWLHPKEEEHLELEQDLEANPIRGPFRPGGLFTPQPYFGVYRGQDASGELGSWLRTEEESQ